MCVHKTWNVKIEKRQLLLILLLTCTLLCYIFSFSKKQRSIIFCYECLGHRVHWYVLTYL